VRVLLVTAALLVSAGVAQAQRLPCSTNPGPNCYNDLRPDDKLKACEHTKDQDTLKCLNQKSSTPTERQGCIDKVKAAQKTCVDKAIR
jgi:endonuclease YncB( thermonuclease family)